MKNHELINYLKNRQFFVLSPHLDDSILSMGMLLYELRKYKNATVINCFTNAHSGPYTLSARQFLKTSNHTNAGNLYKQRAKEDEKVQAALNTKCINLGITDALFRLKNKSHFLGKFIPEFNHIYPTYRWHVTNKINPRDPAIKTLESKLQKLIKSGALVFAPFGIGNHVDHIITSQIATKLFKNLIYYIDFPYNVRLNNFGNPPPGYIKYDLTVDLKIKSRLTGYYASQINCLFQNGVTPKHSEKFFLPEELLK